MQSVNLYKKEEIKRFEIKKKCLETSQKKKKEGRLLHFESNQVLSSVTIRVHCYRCSGSYYGAQCEIDGEVLGVAIGASVAAVIIIVSTLICLCMWR